MQTVGQKFTRQPITFQVVFSNATGTRTRSRVPRARCAAQSAGSRAAPRLWTSAPGGQPRGGTATGAAYVPSAALSRSCCALLGATGDIALLVYRIGTPAIHIDGKSTAAHLRTHRNIVTHGGFLVRIT